MNAEQIIQEETIDAREGQVLDGRYELLMPIAQGGMGRVWLARLKGARGFKKLVAVKTILKSVLSMDLNAAEMMAQEAHIASMIHHPNVVETLELGNCSSGTLYLAMEFVNGETLSSILQKSLKSGGLPLNVALNLVGQVCRGLHAAHELQDDRGELLNLVHRDVNPQNVIVTFSGIAKLLDFGIAKIGVGDSLTQVGELKGKVSYMSPEQLGTEDIDRRTDVFALGIMLYMVTTGTHPFKTATMQHTCLNILNHDPKRPSDADPNYSQEVERIMFKALAKEREARWSTAQEMLEALEQAHPAAFSPTGQREVGEYLNTLLADQVATRRRLIQQAEEMVETSASKTAASGIVTKQPLTTPTPATQPEQRPRRKTATWLLGGIATITTLTVGGALLFSALRPVHTVAPPLEKPKGRPAASVSEYAPMVVFEGHPTPAVPSAARIESNVPTSSRNSGPAVQARARKMGKEAKSDSPYGEDLLVGSGLEAAPTATAEAVIAPPPPVPIASAAPAPEPPKVASLPALPTGPKSVSARIGHAQLRINPNAEAYRPSLSSSMSKLGTFDTSARICVNQAGLVQSVVIMKMLGDSIDRRVIDALRRWKYEPLLDNGHAVAFCYTLAYSF